MYRATAAEEEKQIYKIVDHFIQSVLVEGNVEKAMGVVSDDIMGIGMNEQGTISSREGLLALLNAQKLAPSTFYRVTYPKHVIRCYPPGFSTGYFMYEVTARSGDHKSSSSYIQTFAAKKEEGEWRLCFLQAVPLELTQASIENYPLRFADSTLRYFKQRLNQEFYEVLNHYFSGGVICSYDKPDYPICFINDSLLAILGYSREEFEASMQATLYSLIAPEDMGRLMAWRKASAGNPSFSGRTRWVKKGGSYIWFETRSRRMKDDMGNTIFLTVVMDVTELIALQQETRKQNQIILSSIGYARKIQRNILSRESVFQAVFRDYSILWKPREAVGGDIYWLKQFSAGALLCLCDCTGHGMPGALLSMLVVSALDAIVNEENCQDPARVMWELERRFLDTLNVRDQAPADDMIHIHDGCDAAILFFSKDGAVTLSSANTHVFVCDGTQVRQIKGQKLYIGEGRLRSREDVEVIHLPANPENRFFVATDGLFDQIGCRERTPFGYQRFKDLILRHHSKPLATVSEQVWEAFEAYRGDQSQRDDVQLLSFQA